MQFEWTEETIDGWNIIETTKIHNQTRQDTQKKKYLINEKNDMFLEKVKKLQ